MNELPKLTLITAAYNAAATIERTLKSVAMQGYPDLEYIIMDGGSTDGTLEIIKRYPIVTKLVSEPDEGPPDALNKAVALATNDYIGFINADDAYQPGALLEIGRAIAADVGKPAAVYSGFLYKQMTAHGERIAGYYANPAYMALTVENAIRPILFTFTAFYHQRVFQEYGGFITDKRSYYYINDQEFMLRLALQHERSIGIAEPLMSVYAASTTQSGAKQNIHRIFKERLELVDSLLPKPEISETDKATLNGWHMREGTKKALWEFRHGMFSLSLRTLQSAIKRHGIKPLLYAPCYLLSLFWLKLGLWLSRGIRNDVN